MTHHDFLVFFFINTEEYDLFSGSEISTTDKFEKKYHIEAGMTSYLILLVVHYLFVENLNFIPWKEQKIYPNNN